MKNKLQRGVVSLTEIAVAVGLLTVVTGAIYLNYNSDAEKSKLLLTREREVAAGLLRMKADFSCYPKKLSGLVIKADAADNFCGTTNDLQNWKGPYITPTKVLPNGDLDLSEVTSGASLSIISVGGSWALQTTNVPSAIVSQVLTQCPDSETCLDIAELEPGSPTGAGSPVSNITSHQHALVFDGQMTGGAALGTIVVNNQTAVASIVPGGSFAPVSAIVGTSTYGSAPITAVAVAPSPIPGAPPSVSAPSAPAAPVVAGPGPYTPPPPVYSVPPPPAPAPLPSPAPSGPYFGGQTISISGYNGLSFSRGNVLTVTGTATGVTIQNLRGNAYTTDTCTLTPGQTCNLGGFGKNADQMFADCDTVYSFSTYESAITATMNADGSVSLKVFSVANPWVGWGDVFNYMDVGSIPAGFTGTSVSMGSDSVFTTGSGAGGRCWPPSAP